MTRLVRKTSGANVSRVQFEEGILPDNIMDGDSKALPVCSSTVLEESDILSTWQSRARVYA